MFVAAQRATLLIPSGPAHDLARHHLFICLNDPHGPPRQVLLASVCTVPQAAPCDTTCILQPGDHEFIKHQSYVAYAKCRLLDEAALIRGVQGGVMRDKGLIAQPVFDRIMHGLYQSNYTKPYMIEFIDASYGR